MATFSRMMLPAVWGTVESLWTDLMATGVLAKELSNNVMEPTLASSVPPLEMSIPTSQSLMLIPWYVQPQFQ